MMETIQQAPTFVGGGTSYPHDGTIFGPPFQDRETPGVISTFTPAQRPSFAPYTPPYYYGDSKVTLKYVAASEDETDFKYSRFFNNVTMSFSNPGRDEMFRLVSGSTPTTWPASSSAMQITSSLNLFGLFRENETIFDLNGVPKEVRSASNSWWR